MKYKELLNESMLKLSQDKRVIFIGQSINHGGNAISRTLEGVPLEQRIELPLIEDVQMGMSIGMALSKYIPVSIYPRFDFLVLATNQLVNQLDKIRLLSKGVFRPKVIIRTAVGSKHPIDAGLQHTQDYSDAFRIMLRDVDVINLKEARDITRAYEQALISDNSSLIVEYYSLYDRFE